MRSAAVLLSAVLAVGSAALPVAGLAAEMAAAINAATVNAAAVNAAAAEACPRQVRVSLPNFEIKPYVLGSNSVQSPPGLLIEWTRNALRASGCAPGVVVVRRPPNRQLAEIARGRLDILPGFAYSANERDALVYPMRDGAVDTRRAIVADTVSLYVRAGEMAVDWDGQALRSPRNVVGSSTGGASTDELAQRYGWQLESAPTPLADLNKLVAGHIDVMAEPDMVIAPYLDQAMAGRVRKLQPPASTTLRYAAVRGGFAAQYPAFTERFWYQLCLQSRRSETSLPPCR